MGEAVGAAEAVNVVDACIDYLDFLGSLDSLPLVRQ